MYKVLVKLEKHFMTTEEHGNNYLARMNNPRGKPNEDKVWVENEELWALATFLKTPIVSGKYYSNGTISWCCFAPVTRGFDKGLNEVYATYPAIYILNTAVSTLTPATRDGAIHFRVLKGLRMVSPIPGLDPACLTPEPIRRQNPKPSTPKSKPSTSKVHLVRYLMQQ